MDLISESRDGLDVGVPFTVAYPSKVIKRRNSRIPDLWFFEVVDSFQTRRMIFLNDFFC
jgi:hypothetical protein